MRDVLARQACGGGLYIEVGGAGRDFSRRCFRDRIDSWEEVAIVPARLLRELAEALEGMDEYSPGMGVGGRRTDSVRSVPACRPTGPAGRTKGLPDRLTAVPSGAHARARTRPCAQAYRHPLARLPPAACRLPPAACPPARLPACRLPASRTKGRATAYRGLTPTSVT